MKHFYTLLLLSLLSLMSLGQYSNKGFGFQGYAVDSEGKAISGNNVDVKFTIYITGGGGTNMVETQTVLTDAYGVFSTSIGSGTVTGTAFSELNFSSFDYSLKVEVSKSGSSAFTTISDKGLDAVPYARSASNGVPVGTVVAFMGDETKVPDGWLVCDGSSIATNAKYVQLRSILGSTWGINKLPDLRGVFLRGVNSMGTNGTRTDIYADENAGRLVGEFQDDANKEHLHSGTTNSAGSHDHTILKLPLDNQNGGAGNMATIGSSNGDDEQWADLPSTVGTPTSPSGSISTEGNHTHSFETDETGDVESRPVNAAVIYIIKY